MTFYTNVQEIHLSAVGRPLTASSWKESAHAYLSLEHRLPPNGLVFYDIERI